MNVILNSLVYCLYFVTIICFEAHYNVALLFIAKSLKFDGKSSGLAVS